MINLTYDDLRQKGFNVDEGLTYTGSSEKYLAALQRFYRRSEKNIESIEGAADARNTEDLTILVHALKSNARTIGADTLAGIAERMELDGKQSKIDEMLLAMEDLRGAYSSVLECIKPYGEMEDVHPSSEISAEQAEKIGSELIEAIEDFDDEKSLELIDELMRYPFRFTLINVLKNAREDVREFEYNEALLKIRRVVSQIED